MLTILPKQNTTDTKAISAGMKFPPNVAANIPETTLQKMIGWLYSSYVLPQLLERQAYEPLWDELLEMYKVKLKKDKLRIPKSEKKETLEDRMLENVKSGNQSAVSDTVVYDAVDRLTNLNHFVSWKDGTPIKFQSPREHPNANEGPFYFPSARKYASLNGLLEWSIKNQEVYRKHLICARHHYLYGISFVLSDFVYEMSQIQRQTNQGQQITQSEIIDIGVTFKPLSLRRLWLNYRLPVYDMKYQPCPFHFEATPRFAILQNAYNPETNPFGFVNLDKLTAGQWMFTEPAMQEARKAMQERLESGSQGSGPSLSEIIEPKYSIEALWTFYVMMPFDPATGEFEFRADGKTPVPFKRFIWQSFSNNISAGQIVPVRIQESFYPNGQLPIYGSSHMPDLDSGMYSPAIGEILENHYKEICTAFNQYVDNKNAINDPPFWHMVGSPAENFEVNKPGSKFPVNGPNDVGWRTVPDATGTTVGMITFLREQAQTSSKAVDAVLGKALGSRTSATEASNVFQAAMSGVTTDINLFNFDIMGGYATRVWDFGGLFLSPEILKSITGIYGEPLEPEDFWHRSDMEWQVGSAFIESIVKQQNIRYAVEAAMRSPVLDQAVLWRELFREFKMPECVKAIRDGGFSENVEKATEQAIKTYLGEQIILSPTQDHTIAIEVKTRFLEDLQSDWNTTYGGQAAPIPNMKGQPQARSQYLAEQIALHQQFAMLQMQQQILQQQQQMMMQQGGGSGSLPSGDVPETPGEMAQYAQT